MVKIACSLLHAAATAASTTANKKTSVRNTVFRVPQFFPSCEHGAVAAGKMGKWRRRRRRRGSARAEKNAGSISSLRFVMPRTAATEYEHHRPDKNGVPLSDFMQAISGNVLQNYRYFSPILFPFGFCAGSARERHRSSVCIRWASHSMSDVAPLNVNGRPCVVANGAMVFDCML